MHPDFSLDFPFAYGKPEASAEFRVEPEDFQVDEHLGFEPSGEGEHVYLHIWKRGENTAWVAEKIAELAKINLMDVGFCGRKDRHAVTTQWFSVYLPKKESTPDWSALQSESIKIIAIHRHSHKLRRGDHETNSFVIRLRNLVVADKQRLEQKIQNVLTSGVPNYFGEQRFGREGNNLREAQSMLVDGKRIRDKQKRGLMLSAARSYLFNLVLAERVKQENWLDKIEGEAGVSPSGPLWGRGRSSAQGAALELENGALSNWSAWCDGLEHVGLAQERRALALVPSCTRWHWLEEDLVVGFTLGSGEFATTILRELAVLHTPIKTDPAVL